ncbi:ribosome recycling factor [Shimazuella kribbensis]|uniref:ribosome recycling factor n=1 Tax=Shimazuella kribbensis TaxID=139808 RepID=UPI0004257DDE|nr:ribosome recycling factor [Shimazuella kribbensis]
MINEVKSTMQEKMDKAVQVLKRDLMSLRAGRANPALLDKVMVDYYGSPTPVNQLANISTPDPRTLYIQPWDKTAVAQIEKSILKSELGLTPNNDGAAIRISIPPLTEERRGDLVKMARKMGEEAKVAIRNVRREANDELKKLEKNGEVNEDSSRRGQDEIQKVTDQFVKEIDKIVADKEKEIMEI